MGFCRRCGDIVSGPRCKCGGTPVAPVVQWNTGSNDNERQDRWLQTYTRDKPSVRPPSRGPPSAPQVDQVTSTTSPARRFPRPKSAMGSPILGDKVSAHIASSTSYRPPSALKSNPRVDDTPSLVAADILISPETSELSKAYGSVLQPKETLETFRCYICAAPFPPDATIYPDPSAPSLSADSGRFLCRPCFVLNGGSKGDCHFCKRPVLILKREGGFIEASGNVYHKPCFRCENCFKQIGDNPMVDLLGRPSCADCFDSCLSRKEVSRKAPPSPEVSREEKKAHLGGAVGAGASSREGKSTLDELEQRLGILRNRESTGVAVNTTGTSRSRALSDIRAEDSSPTPRSRNRLKSPEPEIRSPSRARASLSSGGKPTEDAIEEMKRRFLRTSLSSTDTSPVKSEVYLPETPPSKIPISTRGVVSPYLRARRSNPVLADSAQNTPSSTTAPLSPETSRASASDLEVRRSLEPRIRASTSSSMVPTEAERILRTPDLVSDSSDSMTHSSGRTTPPSTSPRTRNTPKAPTSSSVPRPSQNTPTKPRTSDTGTPHKSFHSKRSLENLRIPAPLSPESKCARCAIPLFTTNGGKFVTVPEEPSSVGAQPKVYHSDCFRCRVCDGVFAAGDKGQAVFVRTDSGPCHIECVPPEKVKTRPISSPAPYRRQTLPSAPSAPSVISSSASSSSATNARYESPSYYDPKPPAVSASTTAFPRFGGSNVCPGCYKSVSPMERGVVPGPQGSRWHASCLVCGGQDAKRRIRRADDGRPGCGKKLDSAAKSDGDGGVWCRECLLLLPASVRSPSSVTRSPLITNTTGGGSFWSTRSNSTPGPGRVVQQFTGATTIARQETGLGLVSAANDAILGQLTGGGLSPTRQLGMTGLSKQFTGNGGGIRSHLTGGEIVQSHFTGGSAVRANMTGNGQGRNFVGMRPKSATGFRSAKSTDEGRGMYLVRQMTGGYGNSSEAE